MLGNDDVNGKEENISEATTVSACLDIIGTNIAIEPKILVLKKVK